MKDSVSKTDAREPLESVAPPAGRSEAEPGVAAGTPGGGPPGDAAGTPDVRAAEAVAEAASGDEETPAAEESGGAAPVAEEAAEAEAVGGAEAVEAEAVVDAEAELAAVREELAGLNDRYLRLAAEFTNYRRRVEQERMDVWGRAQRDIVGRFLDVLDDLQRVAGLDLGNATVEGIMEGIDLVDRKFERILGEVGVEVLDPVGLRFDPQTMEAMLRVPAPGEGQDEHVAQVFQKGYALKGQLLRPARVGVFKVE